MIIELPSSTTNADLEQVKYYTMGFFHFSNNNLSIRKRCAEEIGKYDLKARKSEDVDISFRVAQSQDWIALREQGCSVRHKARKSFWAFIKQMWGWGYHVGYPYSKTGIKGLYLYWVSSKKRDITFDLEIPNFPLLICLFLTDFHLAHLFLGIALLAGILGNSLFASVIALIAVFFFWQYLREDRTLGLAFWKNCQIALLHYWANVIFIIATMLGALKHRIFLVPASIFRPTNPENS